MSRLKKNLPIIIGFGLMCMSYTTSRLLEIPSSPLGHTGAPKAIVGGSVKYCTNCHSDFPLNVAGGSVSATGLPSGIYAPGQVYNFSIKITHNAANRVIWGFAIKAVNTVNNDVVGSFSTTNPATTLTGSGSTAELSHANPATFAAANNYTYLNLKWTAPIAPTANQTNIRFYITGVAGDGSGDEVGDYVYTTTIDAALGALPVTINTFNLRAENDNTVNINWETAQELNTAYFEVETSTTGNDWVKLATIGAKGYSSLTQFYSFKDKKPAIYNSNVYYRLKIVDRDGSYKYSAVQVIKLKNAGIIIDNLSAQPLQTGKNGIFKIHCNTGKTITITVSDMSGRLLYNSRAFVNSGANTMEIPGVKISKAKGIVLITFAADGFEETFKQIIN